MQTNIDRPINKDEPRTNVQAAIATNLYEAIEIERKKKKIKLREIINWGLQSWLAQESPGSADKLGLFKKK